jgi:glycosyltransferase involved in cell wall biosynthesis
MSGRAVNSSAAMVSVVIATYNRANLIGRALRSIADQTYREIEIVVVDDGSTDETGAVVERFARDRGSVTYVAQDNRGCAVARNRGLLLAQGEFLTFLDSDDEWLPGAAEAMVGALLETGADFVYAPAVEAEADGSERVNYPVSAGRPRDFAQEHFLRTNVRNGAFMFRKAVLGTVPGLDERLRHNEDSDFIQRVAIGHRAAYTDVPAVRVHHHGSNKSRDRATIYEALLRSAERILQEDPAFRYDLGAAAESRLRELRTAHAEALVLAGRFDEAESVIAACAASVPLAVRAAARTRSTMPLRARRRLHGVRRSVRRAISRRP